MLRMAGLSKESNLRVMKMLVTFWELALAYTAAGADELVFYDITASVEGRSIASDKGGWVKKIGRHLNIPFTVAGGIRSLGEARMVLEAGADKVSINSPALENPSLITSIATEYGVQCVVVGIDSMVVPKRSLQAKQRTAESSAKHSKMLADDCDFEVWQYTGSESHSTRTPRSTGSWIREAIDLGAGEIVLNCMNQDGRRSGYDLHQLSAMRKLCNVPLVAFRRSWQHG